jgi:NACalpha-BTF3-like transcription factor
MLTAEQLRIAQMISDSKRDDPELPEKVNKLVELTQCSSDAAIIALHDSNNDLDQAIVALLDGETEVCAC